MDQRSSSTQKIVIILSILLGFLLVFYFGYTLWNNSQRAQAELAQKEALEKIIRDQEREASISITNEASNPSNFSFESLTQNTNITIASSSDFTLLSTSTEEEILTQPIATPTKPKVMVIKKKPKRTYINRDRPLTAEEIRRIRMLPIDVSATGKLQNQLEAETGGQYTARYK